MGIGDFYGKRDIGKLFLVLIGYTCSAVTEVPGVISLKSALLLAILFKILMSV